MKKQLLTSLAFLSLSSAGAESTTASLAGGLSYEVPAGWKQTVSRSKEFALLFVELPANQNASIQISSPIPLSGGFEATFAESVKQEVTGMKVTSSGATVKGKTPAGQPQLFKQVVVEVSGKVFWRSLYGIQMGQQMVFIRQVATSQELLTRYRPAFDAVLKSLSLSTGAPAANTAVANTAASSSATATSVAGMTAAQIVALSWGENSGTTRTIPGISANPPALELREIYNGLCPWQCLQYTVGGDFPVVNIHQPFPTSGINMMQALVTALARRPNTYSKDDLQADGPLRTGNAPDGSKLLMQEFYDAGSRARSRRTLVIAIERQGVTALVEMRYNGDPDERRTELVLYPVLDTLKFDAAAIAKGRQATQQAVNNAPETVRKAFAAGGKTQIFTRLATTIDTVSPYGGITYEPRTLILLPGGIALRNVPEQDFKNINYPQLLGTNPPGQWKQSGNNIVINWGNETETLQARGSQFVSNIDDDTDDFPWNRTATLTGKDLAGTYTYSYISGNAATALPGQSVYTTAGDGRLTLNAGGTYTLTNSRFGGGTSSPSGVLGPSFTFGGSDNGAESGKWAFDPASYSITFTPNGGRAYSVPAFKRGQNECTTKGCTWMIAGQEWKR